MVGVKISPKGVKIATPKITLGDVATLGSLAAPGMNLLNLGGLSKLSTANIVKNLGLQGLLRGKLTPGAIPGLLAGSSLLGVNGSNPTTNVPSTPNTSALEAQLASILGSLVPYAGQAANQLGQIMNQRNDLTRIGLRAANPANIQAQLDRQRAQLMAQGRRSALSATSSIPTSSTGLRSGVMLGALNNANMQANQATLDANDPANILARYSSMSSLLDPSIPASILGTSMNGLTSLMSALNANKAANNNRNPSTFETALSLLGQIAPNLDWSKIFKF